MSESKHTPGPWAVVETDGGHEIYMASRLESPGLYKAHHIVEYDHGCFGECEQAEEARANARLIAAAPELLEALEKVLGVINESDGVVGWHRNGGIAEWGEFSDIIDAVQAALAKARGEVWDED